MSEQSITTDYILPKLPVTLPNTPLPTDIEEPALLSHWQTQLPLLTESHFVQNAVWRDLFALTGTSRTFYSSQTLSLVWHQTTSSLQAHAFQLLGPCSRTGPGGNAWLDVNFTFQTVGPPATRAKGILSLVPDDSAPSGWKIWMLRTMLEQLLSQPDVDSRPQQALPAVFKAEEGSFEVDCLVMGGGQAGLSVAGRLQTQGVSYVVVERHATPGENWRERYDSAKLHTTRESSHMPFERTWDEERYPHEYLTKDDLAEGYERWVGKYGVNVWWRSSVLGGEWDEKRGRWRIKVRRAGEEVDVICSFFIYAAGLIGEPIMPEWKDRDQFQGLVLHSSEYKNAKAWTGKHGVVIGTANTAHDVAEDMVKANLASVTMVQRSPTYIMNTKHYTELGKRVHNSATDTAVSDYAQMGGPLALGRLMVKGGLAMMAKQTPGYLEGLEKAGYRVERDGDPFQYVFIRFAGHYLDVGSVARITQGQTKIKSDSTVQAFTRDGLRFANGDVLKADVIVMATGYKGDVTSVCSRLFGSHIAKQIGEIWGLDEEGELRGAFRPTGHPAFYFVGGGLNAARFLSRFVALQIKAKLMGTPLPLYTETPFPIRYNLQD